MKKTRLITAAAVLAAGAALSQAPVRIDVSRKSEPISPYVYGQFIEHLGRCIYGGVWAEMVEDRKFYHPVTARFDPWGKSRDDFWNTGDYLYLAASPWRVVGNHETVTMDSARAFTGAHAPSVRLPGDGSPAGIAQFGLAVRAGVAVKGRIVLAGDPSVGPVTVRLRSAKGEILTCAVPAPSAEYREFPLRFKPGATDDAVILEITAAGSGTFRIGTVSLMPADNVRGFRADVLALLRELNAPVYRWPGGNFVSGYDWRDGVGPRDLRPPRKNPAWKGVEPNDVGLHEYMELMRLIGAEPFVSVNTGLGTVEDVATEVEYVNGSKSTPMGRWRAKNGHPEPFGCRWWAVGNEMYGDWQLGHMPLEQYVEKHNRVAEAMWKADPSIKLIAVGDVGKWDETMMRVCAGHMTLISEHIYCREKADPAAHAAQLAESIRFKAEAHRKYRRDFPELKGRDIRIAMDEWNYWYGDYRYGELGVRYHLKDALGVAAGLHEYFRNSDLYAMANYAQTVNVIGAVKTTGTAAAFDATGLPLVLYRREFGTVPVAVSAEGWGRDVSAALTADGRTLTVAVVNAMERGADVPFVIAGASAGPRAGCWTIRHADPMAYNEPGKPAALGIEKSEILLDKGTLPSPAYSICLYRIPLK
jgi:alpha-N-arabinofuranosidase